MKVFSSILSVASGALLFAIAVVPSYAIEVKYSTIGTFSCNGLAGCTVTNLGGGDSEVVVTSGKNSSTLVYDSATQDTILAANKFKNVAFGAGVITPTGVKNGDKFVDGLNQVSLDIQINQSIPTPKSSGDFTGELTGKVSILNGVNTSTAKIDFLDGAGPKPEITLDGVQYELDNKSYTIAVQGTSIQGTMDASALPEPAFFTLTGIGFFGMFGIAWSRYKQRA